MAQAGKSPGGVSFPHPPRGKCKGSCSLDGSPPPLGKENEPSAWDGSDTRSRSKIPVLSKSRLPQDFQQLHQAWESQFQKGKAAGKKPCTQTCPFNLTRKGDRFHVVPCADTAAAMEPPAGSPEPLSRSQPRGPLEEIQLGAAAQKNAPGSSGPSGKEVGPVEFVADPVALASILSNVGLGNGTLGVARKPSLARRVPLRGSRGNSVHASGTARTVHGSLYVASGTPALCPDPARTSCFSRLAPKDAAARATQDPAQHCGLLLKSQQIQALSATLRDLGSRAQPAGHPALQRLGAGACRGRPHPIATATQCEPAGSQEAGGTRDQSANGRPGSLSDGRATGGQAGTGGKSAARSSGSPSRTDPMGASQTALNIEITGNRGKCLKTRTLAMENVKPTGLRPSRLLTVSSPLPAEEFVPDPDALASVLSNMGLSHAALGPTGKLSLARRVPVKGQRGVPPPTEGGTMGSRTSLLRPQGSIPLKGDFSRASCYSTLGLKGTEALDGLQAARLAGTPRTREISRYSPFGSARRVPVTQPQSLRGTCFSSRRLAVFPRTPCTAEAPDKRPAQGALQTPAQWAGSLSPEPRTSDPDESALPWEKIVVRLFGDGESQAAAEASVRKALGRSGEGSSKAQRMEVLAWLLRQEVEGGSSLAELHSLLAACAPSPGPPRPPPPLPGAGLGPKRLPSPSSGQDPGATPPAGSAAFPAAGTTLTFSSQRPVCSHPRIRSLKSPPASGGAAGPRPAAPPSRVALVKQRLGDLLGAPQRFQEACLDDECAFYAGRPPGSQPPAPRCCTDPVATLLEAQETTHFTPIAEPAPGEAGSSLQAALPLPPVR
ncbi:trophinin associated protein [Chelydra serpentina]|uniref:Trophinin associated protein n=1 Tax=Chelydra serpentina TaxID=8475 RepID=A0A8T1SFC6_CHESE|nr:trophinin associated protein [Chelydra serpentina]